MSGKILTREELSRTMDFIVHYFSARASASEWEPFLARIIEAESHDAALRAENAALKARAERAEKVVEAAKRYSGALRAWDEEGGTEKQATELYEADALLESALDAYEKGETNAGEEK